jgi:UDP-N-acetylmuramoyl-L-alanyl-D-glutamate--2,6-diaminopimelate ligase
MQLQDLLDRVDPISVQGDTQRAIERVTQDSRDAGVHDLFVAIAGERVDGHRFVGGVACAAVVVEQDVQAPRGVTRIRVQDSRQALAECAAALAGDPAGQLALVGVTGTNGKTTTCWILESILSAAGTAVGVVGTTGHRIRGTRRPARFTTPLPTQWQGLLRDMVEAGCTVVAAEVSSIGLAARRVDASRFAVGVFTSLGRDHLDFHGDMATYVEAKMRLFRELVVDGGVAVLPAVDPTGTRLTEACARLDVRTYGLDSGQVTARDITLTPGGSRGVLVAPEGEAAFSLSLVGRHNLQNGLAAAPTALALGCSLEEVATGLSCVPVVPGRLEPVPAPGPTAIPGPTVLVDYAHTPDALETVLAALRELAPGRVGVVFGCGGDRDRGKRPEMARAACQGADWVVATTDNPRGEDPLAILEDVRAGLDDQAEIQVDRRLAIRRAIMNWAEPGDLVLIAGKGHEQFQEIQGEQVAFDDRLVAAVALVERGAS